MTFGERTLLRCAAFVAFLVFPATALAGADCRMASDRTLSELNVVLTSARGGRSLEAIDIVEGEVLCVRVRHVGDKDVFEMVSEGSSTDTLRIEFQRMTRRYAPREVRAMLSLRAPAHHGLAYHAGLSLHGSRDVREVFSGSLGAGRGETLGWPINDRVRHHFLLFGLALEPPEQPPVRPLSNFIALSLVSGFHFNALDGLNAEFAKNGYGVVSSLQPYIGFAFDGGIGRFRAAWDLEAGLSRRGDAPTPDTSATFIALHAGFAVLRGGGFALFPMAGIAGGDQRVSIEPRRPALFPTEFVNATGSEDVRKNLYWFVLSLGSEYRWPLTEGHFSRGGILFGVRGGYAFQFAQTNWTRDSALLPDLSDGPTVDASGPYLRLGIGWYEE